MKPPKRKYKHIKCEVCQLTKLCTWHHIKHRRYDDSWIWACVSKYGKQGCHEKIHANPKWAYENGYLIKHNTFYNNQVKKTKKKKCKKCTGCFDPHSNKIICQFCHKEVKEFKHAKKKK